MSARPRLDPAAERDRARAAFEEIVTSVLTDISEHGRICLLAAAGTWAKASAAAAVAEFIELRVAVRHARADALTRRERDASYVDQG